VSEQPLTHRLRPAFALACALAVGSVVGPAHAQTSPSAPVLAAAPQATARIAIISAFEPEITVLLGALKQRQDMTMNGTVFTTGELEGRPVVLFLSGVSMVNAAMNTQLALDRFKVTHIVFSGIAGGVNPALKVGDVTVAARWGQYLESLFAREVSPGKYQAPAWMQMTPYANFGMVHPQNVGVRSVNDPAPGAAGAGRAPCSLPPKTHWQASRWPNALSPRARPRPLV
jgi:adenosylhomocysteine nucleosidase